MRQPYIRVVGIEEVNESNSRTPASFTSEEVRSEIKIAHSKVDFHFTGCCPVAIKIIKVSVFYTRNSVPYLLAVIII